MKIKPQHIAIAALGAFLLWKKRSAAVVGNIGGVAETIYQQLGGNRFKVMTGSKNFYSDGNALVMHLARNRSKAKFLKIELKSDDTYTMIFSKLSKSGELIIVKKLVNVYFDELQENFTEVTGLYTHL